MYRDVHPRTVVQAAPVAPAAAKQLRLGTAAAVDEQFEAQFSPKVQEFRRWRWSGVPDESLSRIVSNLTESQRGTPIGIMASQYPPNMRPGEPAKSHESAPGSFEGPGEFTGGSWEKYSELLREWRDGREPWHTEGEKWWHRYARLHAEVLALKRPARILEYQCPAGKPCGGLADRLMGLTTTFLYALLTDRAFIASFDQPFPLDLVFDSPFIDWSAPSPSLRRTDVPGDAYSRLWASATLLRRRKTMKMQNLEIDPMREVLADVRTGQRDEPWIRFDRLNRGMILQAYNASEPSLVPQLAHLGFTMETAYAQIMHFLFRPKLEALMFIHEYTSLFSLPSFFVVGLQIRTGDFYMRKPQHDWINTPAWHEHWFTCAQEVVDTYSAPGQHPLYYLITDSSTLRESALAAFPDRVVLSGLTPHHAELRDSKKKKFVSGAGRMKNDPDGVLQEVEGMTDSMVESWIFANVDFALLSHDSGFAKNPTFMRAHPGKAIVLPRRKQGGISTPRPQMKSCALPETLSSFADLASDWSLG
ncbi:hypothetical protein Rhopal_000717-T1 [Rhodotorula paludigena]|uniref:Proteophosphoglycan ppg4 n=1 Tax=Rhodotorula paludigena TaxID=86838 RepID=A0AAV5GEJ0_9BASI|nr:hypothetical protein Rhopal_000717-T1 [Rhodotorula paludigena]